MTQRINVLKVEPEFYCKKNGLCNRMYFCINYEDIPSICEHLIVKASDRKIHETIIEDKGPPIRGIHFE